LPNLRRRMWVLFATTDSERMKKTLEGAGFVQRGMSGSDHEENFRYGAKK